MNVSQFVFFDQNSTTSTSNIFGNTGGGSALTLQVDDLGSAAEISLTIEGGVDMNQPDDFFPLKVISLENFKTTKTISSKGVYMVVIDGVAKVRMKSNSAVGGFKAFAVSIQ